MSDEIVPVTVSTDKIRRVYDSLSRLYDYVTRLERGTREHAISIAKIKTNDAVLEVGFGTGRSLLAISKKVGKQGKVCGVDLSRKMLKKARKLAELNGMSKRIDLILGDARNLPLDKDSFDLVFNSYMLDLIDTPEIPKVLLEFRRVTKPSGRLVLVNLSKGGVWCSIMRLYETVYKRLPAYLGGCRPVLTKHFLEKLNFQNIRREFMVSGRVMPSEIVWGTKPNMDLTYKKRDK